MLILKDVIWGDQKSLIMVAEGIQRLVLKKRGSPEPWLLFPQVVVAVAHCPENTGEGKEDDQFGFGANYDFEDDHDLNDCNWAKHR